MRPRSGLAGGLILAAVLIAAALAAAPVAEARKVEATFKLEGSNGYRIRVDANRPASGGIPIFGKRAEALDPSDPLAKAHHHGWVTVSAAKDHGISVYSVRGKVHAREVRARLGNLGRIRVRLHVHRTVEPDPGTSCFDHVRKLIGTFRGAIRFRGEGSYTRLDARKAGGRVVISPAGRGCNQKRRASAQSHGTVLDAESQSTVFEAAENKRATAAAFLALRTEAVGRVHITRLVFRNGDPSEFTFDQSLSAAHVEPPGAWFSGSADFAAPSDWSGPFSVNFPGEPEVPLTGPDFTATLQRY